MNALRILLTIALGRIRVRETLGDDISLCKVQKGGKEIKAAFDRGDAIVAISTD